MASTAVFQDVEQGLLRQEGALASSNDEAFICLYGSSVYRAAHTSDVIDSDIDLFCAIPDKRAETVSIDKLERFVRAIHQLNGLEADEEVPYHNKILYRFSELDAAVSLRAFPQEGAGLVVPKIIKDPIFLAGKAIKLRLGLNALTTPNIVLPQKNDASHTYRELARLAATSLGISLLRGSRFTSDDIHEVLCVSEGGETGEMYLGYKPEHESVRTNLEHLIDQALKRLFDDGHIDTAAGENHFRKSTHFDARLLMSAYVHIMKGVTL